MSGSIEPALGNPHVDSPPLAPGMKTLTEPVGEPVVNAVTADVAAKTLAMLGRARVAVLSPETDVISDGPVVLARYLASQGASVIVMDMSGKATSTKAMLDHAPAQGIKDLMAGSSSFSDAIHCDGASSAHIMPSGTASSKLAAGSASRLPTILEALQQTYDYVVVDCGAADVGGLARISDPSTVNVINVADSTSASVQLASDMLEHAGFRAPLMVHATEDERKLMGLVAA